MSSFLTDTPGRFLRPALIAAAIAGIAAIASGCGSGSPASDHRTLTVFAAASLAQAFAELGAAFEQAHPAVAMQFNFAGSQTLRTQLLQGASADIFAPADWRQMAPVDAAGLLGSAPVYFAANRMVVVTPARSSAVHSLSDLARPGVTLALASPEVPAGAYARQSLRLMDSDPQFHPGFADAVLDNVVTGEVSVRAVAQKVALGEVDAGIVYATDARIPHYAASFRAIAIPSPLNPAAQYPIAALGAAPEPALALLFVDFATSDAAALILRRHGFTTPTNHRIKTHHPVPHQPARPPQSQTIPPSQYP